MIGFWEKQWLCFGEFLAGKYLMHHPEAYFATSTRDLEGEFGAYVTVSLVAIPLFAKFNFYALPSFASAGMWLVAVAFWGMAKSRQGFFRRFLPPMGLFYLSAKRG